MTNKTCWYYVGAVY